MSRVPPAKIWRPRSSSHFGGCFARLFVLQQFHDEVAERDRGQVTGEVRVVSRQEVRFAVAKVEMGWRFAFHLVRHFGVTKRDGDVVVTVTVQERGLMGSDLHQEDAHELVLEHEVMVRFAGDFDRSGLGCLRGHQDRRQHNRTEQPAQFQAADSSIGARPISYSAKSASQEIHPFRVRRIRSSIWAIYFSRARRPAGVRRYSERGMRPSKNLLQVT